MLQRLGFTGAADTDLLGGETAPAAQQVDLLGGGDATVAGDLLGAMERP